MLATVATSGIASGLEVACTTSLAITSPYERKIRMRGNLFAALDLQPQPDTQQQSAFEKTGFRMQFEAVEGDVTIL
jgi:hypothetical protein